MEQATKSAVKTSSIFGLATAAVIAPFATPVLWAALAYGTYQVARGAYRNAKLKEASRGERQEDSWFL